MIQISHLVLPEMYGYWVLGMSIFSIPAIVFVVFREIKKNAKGTQYWALWSLVFLVFPIALFLFKLDIVSLPFASKIANLDIDGAYTFATLSVLYLILEIILLWSNRNKNTLHSLFRFDGLSVWKLAVAIVAIFCLFALTSSHYLTIVIKNESALFSLGLYLYYYIQLFIIYMSYYIYYYIHHNILYNNILKESGLFSYLLGLVLTIILITPIHNLLISFLPVVQDLFLHPTAVVELFDDFNFGLSIMVMTISFPLIVIIEWYKQVNTLAELEQQKSKAELNLLRQQINPHFFFNTLNNLYSMSLTEDKKTPETILQLSELMRYVIYKGKEEKVKLMEEVKYMQDYIKLQMIRIHQTVDLQIDFDIENENALVSPLLFIILLENAFKHGIEPDSQNSTLRISLQERNGNLVFDCYNSKPEISIEESEGIGLDNLKKRLKIVYPDRHDLLVENKQSSYQTILKIKL